MNSSPINGTTFVTIFLISLCACSNGSSPPPDAAGSDAASDGTRVVDSAAEGAVEDANVGNGDSASPTCVLSPQSGCDAGERCGVSATGSATCVPVGTKQAYEDCNHSAPSDECGAGLWCARLPDSPGVPYQCTSFCTGVGSAGSCRQWDACQTQQGLPGRVCQTYSTCRPLAQDCPPGAGGAETCYVVETLGARCFAPPASPVAIGGACALPSDCAIGSSCVHEVGSGAHFCRAHCDPSAAVDACPSGKHCVVFGPAGVCKDD